MNRSLLAVVAATALVSGCTMAKISGRGPHPLILNNPTQKVTVVNHLSAQKRVVFDYTGSFDVSEVLGDAMRMNTTADAVTNVTITVKSDVVDFLINAITLGLAQAKTFAVEGDLVKLGTGVAALMKQGTVLSQAADGAPLTGNLADFAGEGASSPVVVRTEQGLALVKLP